MIKAGLNNTAAKTAASAWFSATGGAEAAPASVFQRSNKAPGKENGTKILSDVGQKAVCVLCFAASRCQGSPGTWKWMFVAFSSIRGIHPAPIC